MLIEPVLACGGYFIATVHPSECLVAKMPLPNSSICYKYSICCTFSPSLQRYYLRTAKVTYISRLALSAIALCPSHASNIQLLISYAITQVFLECSLIQSADKTSIICIDPLCIHYRKHCTSYFKQHGLGKKIFGKSNLMLVKTKVTF